MKTRLDHTSITLRKWVRDQNGRGESVVIGERSGYVDLIIDTSKLTDHAKRALANKSGESVLANGAIRFVVDKSTITETRANS